MVLLVDSSFSDVAAPISFEIVLIDANLRVVETEE